MNARACEKFRWPILTIVLFGFGVVFFGAVSVASVIDPGLVNAPGPSGPWIMAFVLSLILLAGWLFWMSLESVDIDPEGITWHRPGLQSRRLLWSEICALRERSGWQVLELQGGIGLRRINVRFILKDFTRLRQILFDNASGLKVRAADISLLSLPMTFHRSRGLFVASAGITVGLLALGATLTEPLATAMLWGFGLVFLCAILWGWHSMTLERDRIILHAVLRRREIPLQEVSGTEIEDVVIRKYGVTTGVQMHLSLQLKEGKTLKVGSFKDRTVFIRELIEANQKSLATIETRPDP